MTIYVRDLTNEEGNRLLTIAYKNTRIRCRKCAVLDTSGAQRLCGQMKYDMRSVLLDRFPDPVRITNILLDARHLLVEMQLFKQTRMIRRSNLYPINCTSIFNNQQT